MDTRQDYLDIIVQLLVHVEDKYMEVLQIWIGDVSPEVKKSMTKIKNLAKKNGHEYVLISEEEFLRGKYTWINYKSYVETIVSTPSRLKAIWEKFPEGKDSHYLRADVIRFIYLLENKDVLYLDADICLDDFPTIGEKDIVGRHGGLPDYRLMYRGVSETTVFEDVFNTAVDEHLAKDHIPSRRWIYYQLKRRDSIGKLDIIESEYSHI